MRSSELSRFVRLPRTQRLRRAYLKAATPAYLGSLALVTALVLAVPILLSPPGAAGILIALLAILGLGPASDLAVALVNRAVSSLLGPRALPRLELSEGVPPELGTLVVVPTHGSRRPGSL